LVLLLATTPGFAQFLNTSSSPADGEAEVNLETLVSFTFNAPLDTSARYEGYCDDEAEYPIALTISEPCESFEIGGWSVSPDLQTVNFDVSHQEDADYTWAIYAGGGQYLDEPWVVRYSTAGVMGQHQVTGTVAVEEGDPIYAMVGLFDIPPFSDENAEILMGAIVPDAGGEYVMPFVRDGVYYPIGAQDVDLDGVIDPEDGDLVGFYDPDQNGEPDSIAVVGDDLSGIDLFLIAMEPITAREMLQEAWNVADSYAGDQELVLTLSADDWLEDDGRAMGWYYEFFSPGGEFYTTVIVGPLMFEADTSEFSDFPEERGAIPEPFIDSDEALTIAIENGGGDYMEEVDVWERSLIGGNLWWLYPEDPDAVFWTARFFGWNPEHEWEEELLILIDIETGEVLDVTGVTRPDPAQPGICELEPNVPNPFNPETRIDFVLHRPATVKLAVYDLLGRRVAVLHEGLLPAGNHTRVFMAQGLASGVYLYSLEAGGRREARRMLLVK